MKKVYKVTYRMVDYPTILIEANSKEEAGDAVANLDGSMFTPGEDLESEWDESDIEEVSADDVLEEDVYDADMIHHHLSAGGTVKTFTQEVSS